LLFLLIMLISVAGSIIVTKNTEKAFLIYLDPGHGGSDGGAVANNDIMEKDIVLEVSFFLKDYLENAGFLVKMTRYGDYDLAPTYSKNRKRDDIYKRCSLINNTNCLLYISIHANKFPDKNVHGAQVFYNNQCLESKRLSETIQEMISAITQNTNRVAKSINGKYLIEHVKKIGCLVEIGFLSNLQELELLIKESYQKKMAYAIYAGIISFLEGKNKI